MFSSVIIYYKIISHIYDIHDYIIIDFSYIYFYFRYSDLKEKYVSLENEFKYALRIEESRHKEARNVI